MEEASLFQNFVIGLLTHEGYKDLRLSAVHNDFGRDAVAITPKGEKCFVAASFTCTLAKVRADAKRWTDDPNREDATVMLFATAESPTNTKVSPWVKKIRDDFGLELRLFNRETVINTATRTDVWQETCARLRVLGERPGYTKVSPFDEALVRRGLKARPPEWLRQRVPLKEWDELTQTLRNRLILGKPGAGKTTTIFVQLERAEPETVIIVETPLSEASQVTAVLDAATDGAVIVFDDLHEDHKGFTALCSGLRDRRRDAGEIADQYKRVVLLAGSRSQEWADVKGEIPSTVLEDMHLVGDGVLTLAGLDVAACRGLIEICRDEWELIIQERLLEQAARASAERDATPLFVISVLAAARGRDDRTLRDEHLAGLPRNVRDLWQRYWEKLDANSQGVLRLVRLFWAAETPPLPTLLNEAAKAFSIPPAEVVKALDRLERSLWLTRTAGVPACLDVQFEVIDLDSFWLDLWDEFVFQCGTDVEVRLHLHNGTGNFYSGHIVLRAKERSDYARRLTAAGKHFEVVERIGRDRGHKHTVSLALNNASNIFGRLAQLEARRVGRRSSLVKAVEAAEESIAIRRELGLRSWLAGSLNNVSNHYGGLARLETTRERRQSWLEKAVEAVEESITIVRELGVRSKLATSLSTASNGYSHLADLEATREGRRSCFEKAVNAVEESIAIHRDLGLTGDLAGTLNNVSLRYGNLAGLQTTREGRQSWLEKAVEAAEESAAIRRRLGLRRSLAASLNNVSTHYRGRAGIETTRKLRRFWLEKAVKAVEESITIHRELGLTGELASSLGSLCQHQRAFAETEVEPAETARRLSLSREAISEAVALFREAGNTSQLLLAYEYAVTARLEQLPIGGEVDVEELMGFIEEGLTLAQSMEDEEMTAFFTDVKRKLTEGGANAAAM